MNGATEGVSSKKVIAYSSKVPEPLQEGLLCPSFHVRSQYLSQAYQPGLLLVSSPLIPVSAISRASLDALSAKLSNVLRTTLPSSSLLHAIIYPTEENGFLDVWASKTRKGLFVLEPMPTLSCSTGKVWFTKPGLRERKYGRNPSEVLKLEFF